MSAGSIRATNTVIRPFFNLNPSINFSSPSASVFSGYIRPGIKSCSCSILINISMYTSAPSWFDDFYFSARYSMSSFVIPRRLAPGLPTPGKGLPLPVSIGPEIGTPSERLIIGHLHRSTSSCGTRLWAPALVVAVVMENFNSLSFCFRASIVHGPRSDTTLFS